MTPVSRPSAAWYAARNARAALVAQHARRRPTALPRARRRVWARRRVSCIAHLFGGWGDR